MNLRQVARLLAGFTLFFTLAQGVPFAVAIGERDTDTITGFGAGIALGLLVALLLRLLGRTERHQVYRKEGLVVVGAAWVLAGALGGIPFVWSGTLHDGADAMFEAISGLTTTGATVFGSGDNVAVESLPDSILLWRAMMHWMGGLGIVLVFLVLLPPMGMTGKALLDSEQVGLGDDDVRPRMLQHARALFLVYVAMTIAGILLYLAAGMTPLDAICHALAAFSTGGFSTRNASIGAYGSLPIELLTILFMFLGGMNFVLLLGIVRRDSPDFLRPHRNPEFRAYAFVCAAITLVIAASLWHWGAALRDEASGAVRDYSDPLRCLRDAAFQTVSIQTSTGYCTADFQNWPKAATFLLAACMLMGGCTGSTAGGLRIVRVLIFVKLVRHTLHAFVRPRVVEKVRIGDDVVSDRVLLGALTLLLLWLACAAAGTLLLSLDPRLDLVSSLTACLSMLGCGGPAISSVAPAADGTFHLVGENALDLGPYGGFGGLGAPAKLLLTLLMIFGRLEIIAPLALLTPSFWRR